jgi:GTP-binding protein
MEITSAQFLKGIVGPDIVLENKIPQVAFVGRSNVGKSSIINSLAKQKNLARTSASPGRTQEINLYLINNAGYLLDLPGYGYAKASKETRIELGKVIRGYLFESAYVQKKVVLVIDAHVGPSKLDLEMLRLLEEREKNVVIVANKIDKVKRSEYVKQLADIQKKVGAHAVIPFSAEKKIGRKVLLREIL